MFSGISEKLDKKDVNLVQKHVFTGHSSEALDSKGNFALSSVEKVSFKVEFKSFQIKMLKRPTEKERKVSIFNNENDLQDEYQ